MVLIVVLFTTATATALYQDKTKQKNNNNILDLYNSSAEKSVETDSYEEVIKKEAATIAEKMSSAQLASQVMMISYPDSEPPPEIFEWIKKGIGAIKIFGWNFNRLQDLTESINKMQNAAGKNTFPLPLIIATDQEGGWVRHIRGQTSITAGNMAIGASGIIKDAWLSGKHIGEELKLIGINMNFAPTVDVLIDRNAHVIGPRAFSDDPTETAIFSVSYMNGMKEAGIMSTAKHFPGHGRSPDDSHGTLPISNVDLDILLKEDFLPYYSLIKEKIPAVMSGHLAFPEITREHTAASLSPFFLKEILRKKMGFEGIILTDDMQMSGALASSGLVKSSLSALKAGNDMLVVSCRDMEDYKRIWNLIISEIEKDAAFKTQIKESVTRIITAKYLYIGKNAIESIIPEKQIQKNITGIPTKEASAFFRDLAFRSVSILYKDKELIVPQKGEKILIASSYRTFLQEGLKKFPNAETFNYPFRPYSNARKEDLLKLPELAKKADIIIFSAVNPSSIELLETLKNLDCKVYVISILSPVHLDGADWVDWAVAIYGTGADSFEAGFEAVTGEFIPRGNIPIEFPVQKKK